jgi:hypothetical protein
MNKVIRNTLIVIAILVLASGVFFAGTMFARVNAYGPAGMMGGFVSNAGNNNGYGHGMMGGGQGGYRLMGGNGYNIANVAPLSLDEAKAAAESYLATLDIPDLRISEIMIFNNNAYVVVTETSAGLGAFELLVDPVSRIAYPEHGPNIMWNLKYGGLNHQNMMGGRGGMMGNSGFSNTIPSEVSADMTVSPEKAIEYAQTYLDANLPGATAATDPIQFYGYYTLDFERDGVVVGMLSVNGYSGQVFLHTWHETFIEEMMY